MKDTMKDMTKHIASILMTGMTAAGIAFLQSTLAQTGACDAITMSPENVGAIGAGTKFTVDIIKSMI